jgi:hypothetical protein
MEKPTEEQIRSRAHELWEQAGRPEGREDEFWYLAEQEFQSAGDGGDPGTEHLGRYLVHEMIAAGPT